jgi:NAD(P) transhydrogenase subunit alpha
MISGMKPESVIVDMAVDSGGNVEGSRLGQEALVHGVRIIGYPSLARRVPVHASQMYASNLYNLIEHYWDREKKELVLDKEDEIVQGCLLTRDGELVNDRLNEAYAS